MTLVTLVDQYDHPVGTSEKISAHQNPAPLHRAFSVFIFDNFNRILLQRRSLTKYHFAGLWANSCCGHPEPGEPVETAAIRRCRQELGIDLTELTELGAVTYSAVDPKSSLIENEYDHILVGPLQKQYLTPNPDEVEAVGWIHSSRLPRVVERFPRLFAPWMPPIMERFGNSIVTAGAG